MAEVASLRGYKRREGDVRIDRGTPWGNPFHIGPDGTREDVIEAYREYIHERPALVERLRAKSPARLLCWCAPQACHGDVLAELLEALDA